MTTNYALRGAVFGILFSLPLWAIILGAAALIFLTPGQASVRVPSTQTPQVFNDDLTIKSPAPVLRNGDLGTLLGVK